jgi:hypothetical protein
MAITIGTRPASIDGCWASWTEKAEPVVIRTNMEDGTIKVRRRSTGKLRVASVSRTFPATEYQAFQDWFTVACQQGVIPTRVMTPYGKEEVWRFTEAPQISWADPKAFNVTCALEQLSGWETL